MPTFPSVGDAADFVLDTLTTMVDAGATTQAYADDVSGLVSTALYNPAAAADWGAAEVWAALPLTDNDAVVASFFRYMAENLPAGPGDETLLAIFDSAASGAEWGAYASNPFAESSVMSEAAAETADDIEAAAAPITDEVDRLANPEAHADERDPFGFAAIGAAIGTGAGLVLGVPPTAGAVIGAGVGYKLAGWLNTRPGGQ